MKIRPAVPDDVSAVRACADEAYAPYIAAIGRKPAPMIADFEAQIGAGQVYVAEDETGSFLGFVVYFPRADHMFLENVAVVSAAAGRGIGKALVSHCEAEARSLGLSAIRLYTNEKMTANLRIYPKLGYTETGRRTEDGFNRVYFEKSLF
ncbi:Sortase [Roseibium alexandrii DFL-11]|uniref:Sortase n=2 Tax=Roseibium alexandrii TaxID=388408 RepID=A0A5E8GTS0_ROSAD|nr:Sortase [Roseibium alexandrii DFL-11]